METISKKYYSISEVAKVTGIPQHKLRYFEKSNSKLEIYQIKGRRYYTKDDIELIKHKINSNNRPDKHMPYGSPSSNIISQIDSLITKLTQLEGNIRF